MLKGKGVFAVIAIILVVGLGITSYTSHYINKQKSLANDTAGGFAAAETTAAAEPAKAASQGTEQAMEQMAAPAQEPGSDGSQAPGAGASASDSPSDGAQPAEAGVRAAAAAENSPEAAAAMQKLDAAEDGEAAPQESASEQPSLVMISPLSGVLEPVYEEKEEASAETATIMEQKEAYIKRLDELSAQIDKLWKTDTDATSNSMKQTADYELKMWDNELNKIYQEVRKSLNEADAEALKETELQWIKDRDAKALAASKQVGNSSLESLEYTRTLAASTKARTYELVEIYFSEESNIASE